MRTPEALGSQTCLPNHIITDEGSKVIAQNNTKRMSDCRESNPNLRFRKPAFYPLNYSRVEASMKTGNKLTFSIISYQVDSEGLEPSTFGL